MKEDAVGGLLDLGPRADAAGPALAPEHVLSSRMDIVKVCTRNGRHEKSSNKESPKH